MLNEIHNTKLIYSAVEKNVGICSIVPEVAEPYMVLQVGKHALKKNFAGNIWATFYVVGN